MHLKCSLLQPNRRTEETLAAVMHLQDNSSVSIQMNNADQYFCNLFPSVHVNTAHPMQHAP